MTYHAPYERAGQAYSAASVIAVIAAIASFFVSAGFAVLLAIVALVFGAIGLLMSFSPRTRGGVISVISVLLGAVGIVAAIVRLVL